MVDLVVDDVEQQIMHDVLVQTECRQCLLEALRRDLWPELVDLVGALIPETEDLVARAGLTRDRRIPLAGNDAAHHGRSHADHFHRERTERPHVANGEAEQLVLGKCQDGASAQPAMSLPVLQ